MVIDKGKQELGKQPECKFVCQPCLFLFCILVVYIRGTQVFQKLRGHLKILVAPKILVVTVQTLRPDELATRTGVTIFISTSCLMPSNSRMISD